MYTDCQGSLFKQWGGSGSGLGGCASVITCTVLVLRIRVQNVGNFAFLWLLVFFCFVCVASSLSFVCCSLHGGLCSDLEVTVVVEISKVTFFALACKLFINACIVRYTQILYQ